MAKPVVGDVVVVPFPFSDLSGLKRRPALVLAALDGDDLVLCMITSRPVSDRYAVALNNVDFDSGGLPVPSNIRPSRLFTAHSSLCISVAGHVKPELLDVTLDALRTIFEAR